MAESTSFFDEPDPIFANKDLLRVQHLPDKDRIIGRDEELTQLANAIKDAAHGRTPNNVLVYGKTGTGKSLCTKYITNDLVPSAEENDVTVGVAYVDCFQDSTETQTVRSIADSLNEPAETDINIPMSGLSTSDYYRRLWNILEARYDVGLVILDEIDKLESDDVLMQLSRAAESGKIEESTLGIIGISNNYTFRQRLSAKVQDALKEEEISFSTYDANELRAILHDRAEKALSDESYSNSAIAKAAAVAGRDTGSARQAIDLLRKGAEIVEQNDEQMVEDDHIGLAREAVKRGRLQDKIEDQSLHARLVLEAVAQLDHVGETPARSKEIMKMYRRVAAKRAEEPLTTLKSIQNHLSDLYMLGFLLRREENEGRKGGSYHEYDLDMDPDVVFEVCDELDREEAV